MTIYPALDLRGGRCVRLLQGAFDRETVYGDDPVAVARCWEAAGARWLHVVDLDGARVGRPVQAELVASICAAVRVPVQVGGGLRSAEGVAAVLEAGAARAVVGTVAVAAPERCREICRAFPGRVALGLDARGGHLHTAGWTEAAAETPQALAARAAELGAAAVIYTDIARDGTEQGPDVEGIRALARASGVPVIASGGIGSVADVRTVVALAPDGVEGLIIGRALYTGRVTLADALALAGEA